MRAISSMATKDLLGDLLASAAAEGLPAVELESVGGVDAARRVAAGEDLDLVFLASDAVQKLVDIGRVDGGTVTPFAVSSTAVAVRSDAVLTARIEGGGIADADGVRAMLRAAGSIGYSTGPSGTELIRLIDSWNMTEELAHRLVQARPGIPVARLLTSGEVDLGFQQLSELVGRPGVRVLGSLPADCAIDTLFCAALTPGASEIAADVLAHLTSPARHDIVCDHRFSVPDGAQHADPL